MSSDNTIDASEIEDFDQPIGPIYRVPIVIDPVAQAEIDRLREHLRLARSQLWREWVANGSLSARQAFEFTKP